jgi:hypothetical protein
VRLPARSLWSVRGGTGNSGAARGRSFAMALIDYTKLCPRSGHVLTRDEREALAPAPVARGKSPPAIRCEACGQCVTLVLHPGTGRSLIFPMHLRGGDGGGRGGAPADASLLGERRR